MQETGFVNQDNINPAGTWSLGLLQMDFFYREKPWYAGQFVRKIIPKFKLKRNVILFFTVLLNKQKKNLLSGLVRDVDKTFNNAKIQLPIKNKKIDFDFIDHFMNKLEVEHIMLLDKYLTVCNFKNYNLTTQEENVLKDYAQNKIKFGEFKIKELFEINSYKKRFDANKVTITNIGKPYVVRTSLNNGLRGYINENEEYLNEGNTISFGQDTATMFYQEKPYFTGDKIKIVKPKNNQFSKQNAHFFISTMTKSFSSFSWGNSSFSVKIIENQKIQIPIKDKNPDYEIMNTIMSAMKKLIIKDVVLYADKKLK